VEEARHQAGSPMLTAWACRKTCFSSWCSWPGRCWSPAPKGSRREARPIIVSALSLIPIATELQVNSICGSQTQGHAGFGNITGAMVFQGALLPAIGIR
jgi:hypothetical protein